MTGLLIFGLITLLALGGLVALGVWQIRRLRRGEVTVIDVGPLSLFAMCERRIERWYYLFGFVFRQLAHYLYFYSLVTVHFLVIAFKSLLTLAEGRFSRLIDSVRGRGVLHKRGAVSLFLTQISQVKDK